MLGAPGRASGVVSLVAILIGCGPGTPAGSGGATGTSGTSSGTTPTTTGPTTTTVGVPGPTGSSAGEESSAATRGTSEHSGTDTGQNFIMPPDDGHSGCDNWAQDCPRGEKCTVYAADLGNSWNAAKCVPVMDDPAQVGEECFVVDGPASGIDNCDLGAFCWDVDAENKGTCIGLCTGSSEAPHCVPGSFCVIAAEAFLHFCFAGCNPLAQDCEAGMKCATIWTGEGFECVEDHFNVKGELHDYCQQYDYSCNFGLVCLESSAAVECDHNYNHCCEPFCDLLAPNTCPGQGQKCEPFFAAGLVVPPEYEKLGVCKVPQ